MRLTDEALTSPAMTSRSPDPTPQTPPAAQVSTGPVLAAAVLGSQVKAGGPSCKHPPPQPEGSGLLNPETRGQLLPLTHCPSGCHRARPLPRPSCLAPGPLLTCFTRPSAGQPGHGLQEGSPSHRRNPAGRRVALPHWPCLLRSRAPAWGWGWLGVLPCGSQPAFSLGGRLLPQCHALQVRGSGSTAQGSRSILGCGQQPHLNSQLLCGAFTCCRRKL